MGLYMGCCGLGVLWVGAVWGAVVWGCSGVGVQWCGGAVVWGCCGSGLWFGGAVVWGCSGVGVQWFGLGVQWFGLGVLRRRLLEKSQRVEAILGSMLATGAERAQLQEVEEMITAPERLQLDGLKRSVNK